MPSIYYKRNFVPGYYYHIYNRGANKKRVFRERQDYQTFTDILSYYLQFPIGRPLSYLDILKVRNLKDNTEPISVSLAAYVLMPNHFHLLIKQVKMPDSENGIPNLMKRLTITYAMYAKKKYDRSGVLFEGKYKNILVDNDPQLLQLTKYIHKNPKEIIGSVPLESYLFSSYPVYAGKTQELKWLSPNDVLAFFSKTNPNHNYRKFVEESPINTDLLSGISLD